jgi:hypothetical protein
MQDLDHPILVGAKNIDSWHTGTEDLHRAFSLDILMVPSPKLNFVANGNNPISIGHAPDSTISSSSLEFPTDLVIPRFRKMKPKSPYVCPGCSNHTYSNNMITDEIFN